MYMRKEVQEKIIKELESLSYIAKSKVRRNKWDIKKLAHEQAILKRSAKQYNDIIWELKNKKN